MRCSNARRQTSTGTRPIASPFKDQRGTGRCPGPRWFSEDSAIIDFGDEVCIISSDPITGAVAGSGACGPCVLQRCGCLWGSPVGIQVVLLLPEHIEEEQIGEIMTDIQHAWQGLE